MSKARDDCAGVHVMDDRAGPCQRFARNCAPRNLTSPHNPTLDSTSHLRGCVGTKGVERCCEPPAHRWHARGQGFMPPQLHHSISGSLCPMRARSLTGDRGLTAKVPVSRPMRDRAPGPSCGPVMTTHGVADVQAADDAVEDSMTPSPEPRRQPASQRRPRPTPLVPPPRCARASRTRRWRSAWR